MRALIVLQEMETHEYGIMSSDGLEIVRRDGRLFVRYDAGAHFAQFREDEITEDEFGGLLSDGRGRNKTLLEIQRRLEKSGVDPYKSNWSPV